MVGPGNGAAYVFVRAGATWNQQQVLQASGTAQFGMALSVSGDIAFVGDPDIHNFAGAVFVFVRSGATWTQAQEIDAPDPGSEGGFGSAVVVQGDTAVVGAPGGAYVFVRSGSAWVQQQKLTAGSSPDGGATDSFGAAVALDGDTVIVGTPPPVAGTGGAYVFVRSGSAWSLQQVLTQADGTAEDLFGDTVAVAGDLALVGAPHHQPIGAAYLFARSGGTWTQAQELIPDATSQVFGQSVVIDSGQTAVLGASDTGMTEVYAYAVSGPALTPALTFDTGPSQDSFTLGVQLAMDGTTLVVGVPLEGAAFVFDLGAADGDPCTSAGTCFSGACVDGVLAAPSRPARRRAPATTPRPASRGRGSAR